MVIIPDSRIKLIKNPLKLDSNNEIMFNDETDQYNYFNSLPKLEFEKLTYIRKDGILKIETDEDLTYEDLLGYNFCMYQNSHFDNKWFYAFITDINWINPGLTEMKLETAYYQTWQFDLIYKDSFIEREHVNNDTPGLHTLPENLETGSPIMLTNSQKVYDIDNYYICMAVTELIGSLKTHGSFGRVYNKVYSGFYYLIFDSINYTSVGKIIDYYDSEGKGEAINSLFIVPDDINITEFYPIQFTGDPTIYYYAFASYINGAYQLGNYSFNKPTALKTYTPKNKKLLTAPFSYFYLTNNVGSDVEYHYEDFYDNTIQFNTFGALTPGFSLKTVPFNYKYNNDTVGIDDNGYNYGIVGSKLPVCSWDSDVYINWLTQNANNIALGLVTDTLNIGMGIANLALGNPAGLGQIVGGNAGIANKLAEVKKMEIIPPQAKGSVNSGDVTFASGRSGIYIYQMCIKEEYAKIIDDYFSMFGYKVNRLGTPHLHVRQNYDYIKTIDVNIEGDIPEPDLNQIRNMFNNGIRFWHSTTNYLNFSVNNNIIS